METKGVTPYDIVKIFQGLAKGRTTEEAWAIGLDENHNPTGEPFAVSKPGSGTADRVMVPGNKQGWQPIVDKLKAQGAVYIALAHNHPTLQSNNGVEDATPSAEDLLTTKQQVNVLNKLGMKVADVWVVTDHANTQLTYVASMMDEPKAMLMAVLKQALGYGNPLLNTQKVK